MATADVQTLLNHTLPIVTRVANLLGAVVVFFYFRFIDPVAAAGASPRAVEIVFAVVGFALIVLGLRFWGARIFRPLVDARGVDPALVKRRAVLLPYMYAGLTLAGWTAGGLIWGVVWPLILGVLSLAVAARVFFGIAVIAGSLATVFIFLTVEHRWREVLPTFFPEGDLDAVRDVMRLSVRTRLLVMFLMVGVLPLSVLGVFAYTRSQALLAAPAADAGEIVAWTLPVILFFVAAGIAAAVGLSIFVARSVDRPLRQLAGAMAEVGQGNLERRCPVVGNDEIGAVTAGFNRMVHGLREREFVKETFGKYVTREIRDEILAGRVALGGQALEVTILFADLRDFTPWVEATPAEDVVRELNAYFTEMELAIREHRGLVLQFIGDEIEAVFGAPVAYPGHATLAVQAALAMRRRLAAWNAAREAAGKPPLRHGIGIHSGAVLAGNIGSAERLSYALVGDAVNLASRLQQLTKEAGAEILVSGATRRMLGDGFETVPLPAARVKGKSAEVEVYRLA